MKKTIACQALLAILWIAAKASAAESSTPNAATTAANQASSQESVSPSVFEEHFQALLTDATLSGRWASLTDGQLGEERSGDKYQIVSATKDSGEKWIVRARIKYRDQELTVPIPVQVKFAGDTAVMIVDKLSIPDGGTYSARILFYQGTYSGTWSGARGGGMLYGVITNAKEKPAPSN